MKLVSLNIWGGRAFDPLMQFVNSLAKDTDIFCFQEIFASPSDAIESRGTRINILSDMAKALPDFFWYFAPEGEGYDEQGPVDFEVSCGQAIFLSKKTLSDCLTAEGSIVTFKKEGKSEGSNFQYVRLLVKGKIITICNIHGIPLPGHKKDTDDRLSQSRIVMDFLSKEPGAKILCGDFNLLPDTESMKILEEGMVNLITKLTIPRTRSRLHPFYGKPDDQKFADYLLASPDVAVKSFSVPDVSVSDHLPLIAEFE